MKAILESIKNRFHALCESMAQAITDSDWANVARCGGILLVAACIALVIIAAVAALAWKLLGTFLGKVLLTLLGAPFVLCLLGLSYKINHEDADARQTRQSEAAALEAWAEDVYDVVRDAIFLVLRALSEYTVVVRPTSPGAVELPSGISIRDGYAVFTFFARISGPVDAAQLKREITRTLGQMLRAHELSGIASDLVQINGSYYCPLQVLDLADYGDSIHISVVFATEKTVELVRAKKMLHLEKRPLGTTRDTLYDDEL